MDIRENQIEDILVTCPILTKNILELDDEPRLVGRQIIIPSGRLDMLYSYKTEFLLLELKVVSFQKKFIQQVLDYKKDLIQLQTLGKLLKGDVKPYLLLPNVTPSHVKLSENEGVICLSYSPEDVLKYFYSEKLKPITSFSEIKPIDIGIWNIHLIHKFIYELITTDSIKVLQNKVDGANKSLYNKIKFSNELGLLIWNPNSDYISLSELGKKYVNARDNNYSDRLSEKQVEIMKNYIMQNPYASSVVLGISAMVESIFALSKNVYPVLISQLQEFFTYYSGKIYDWQTEKAKSHGVKMYSNYAINLGLIAKTEKSVYLTPEGFKFVIQLQLHKSLRLMDNIKITLN